MEMENILGMMDVGIPGSGKIISCMDMVNYFMKMVEVIRANIRMTKNMDKVFILGQMVKNMKVAGKTESNMARPLLQLLKEYLKPAYGKTVNA